MTPNQAYLIGAIGGASLAVTLALIVLLALALHAAVSRIIDLHDAYRERRTHARQQAAELATLHAIDALGTTPHPKEH
ncbi:hypothetical protein ACPXCS_06150 [Streptomyces sp. DT190]|uniref:hypothetical protein n=1 Tax=unclassified Streptomyces TaxID=2593676 RepID=UPI003CFA04C2